MLAALGFWATLAILTIIIMVLVDTEHGFWAFATGAVGISFVAYVDKLNPWQFLKANYGTLIEYAVIYLALGVVWSFPRWWIFLKEDLHRQEAYKTKYSSPAIVIPQASRNKARICNWMAWRPFSTLGIFLNKFIRRVWHFFYDLLSTLYQNMANSVFKEYTKPKVVEQWPEA